MNKNRSTDMRWICYHTLSYPHLFLITSLMVLDYFHVTNSFYFIGKKKFY